MALDVIGGIGVGDLFLVRAAQAGGPAAVALDVVRTAEAGCVGLVGWDTPAVALDIVDWAPVAGCVGLVGGDEPAVTLDVLRGAGLGDVLLVGAAETGDHLAVTFDVVDGAPVAGCGVLRVLGVGVLGHGRLLLRCPDRFRCLTRTLPSQRPPVCQSADTVGVSHPMVAASGGRR